MEELFSIEVFVRKLYSTDVPCHLPSISFRLLDFPAQTIHLTDSDRISKIQTKVAANSDNLRDLARLRNSNGDIVFNKGKSCLFPLSFDSAHSQLSEIPLYLVLTESVTPAAKFIGSIGISLANMLNSMRDSLVADPSKICNESVRGSYPIKNLMGSRVAKLAVEVKLFYYGTNLVHHIPALSNVLERKHDTSITSKSDHLMSNKAISSVMEEIDSFDINRTSDLFSRDESDSDKERDETENPNPPPLFYQASRDPSHEVSETPSAKKKVALRKRDRSKSEGESTTSDVGLEKLVNFSHAKKLIQPSMDSLTEGFDGMMNREYNPKRFDLIRAVLTELTYLTDFLDPNIAADNSQLPTESLETALSNKHAATRPRPPKQPKPVTTTNTPARTPKRYGLTNSYILRLGKLGPDKAKEVLTKHIGRDSAAQVVGRLDPNQSKLLQLFIESIISWIIIKL